MQGRHPIYIPSKGRADYMMTSRVLTGLGVRHIVVVEPQEETQYRAAVNGMGLLASVLPMDLSYKDRYETCDSLGMSKGTGGGAARNFLWDHSISEGHGWHWTMDDNIRSFRRLNKNEKVKVSDGAIFRAMEDFCERYRNVAMAGPNYFMFASARSRVKPFVANTRIYSCNLIRNDVPFRWRGRYNEDTILSLDMLKAGWCTVQFNAFLQEKSVTQSMSGGNTDELYEGGTRCKGEKYAKTGTLAKSQMLVDVHPDVSKVVWRYGRVHHHVDYRPFRKNVLLRRGGLDCPSGTNEYGMKLSRAKMNEVESSV